MAFLLKTVLRIGTVVSLCWIVAAVSICFRGITMPYEPADMAVILGNALNDDGTPKSILAARLDVAVQCHRMGRCPLLFVGGSIDEPQGSEALAMRTYLMNRGVAADAIVTDDQGDHTLASARNATAFMREHGFTRITLITQYYHIARARMAFDRAGAPTVFGVYPRQFRLMDIYSSWREVPAFALYFVRLALDPDAAPVSFRPVRFLWNLLSPSGRVR